MPLISHSKPTSAKKPLIRHVAVLVETDDSWGRSLIHGIADYIEKHSRWVLLIEPRDERRRLALPTGWQGDGVIARLGSLWMADHLRQSGVPVVDTDTVMLNETWAGRVITDDTERARLALHHFRDRGFERFAYFAPPKRRYSNVRGEIFQRSVQEIGFDCAVYRPNYRIGRRISWNEQQKHVSEWLRSLPRPIAIFTVDGHRGRELAEICHVLDIQVPDEVAILAGDTDELMCNVSSPPLSSVQLACGRIGYEAAALLDRLMQGEPVPKAPIQIKPLFVIPRQSTDVLSIDDEHIVRALRFIRAHATGGIVVDDVLRNVPVSRRGLEIQFRKLLGRSPAEEIRRVRLEKGKRLLATTEMSIAEIAKACGFASATRLGVAFRSHFGITPLAYRRQTHG
ncbi:MAG: DNA-binding transcriptional regulator [Pirellulales bacterium]|nr:DNA-binding transcriptional regulator [Pirellulales bacterium]